MEIGFSIPESFSPRLLLSSLQKGRGGSELSMVVVVGVMGAEELAWVGCLFCARHLRGIDAFNRHDEPLPGTGNGGSEKLVV